MSLLSCPSCRGELTFVTEDADNETLACQGCGFLTPTDEFLCCQ